jgi:hypothetical protein
MNTPDVTMRCQNCGCFKREHSRPSPFRCPTRLYEAYWKPWTVEEYEAAEKAGQALHRVVRP